MNMDNGGAPDDTDTCPIMENGVMLDHPLKNEQVMDPCSNHISGNPTEEHNQCNIPHIPNLETNQMEDVVSIQENQEPIGSETPEENKVSLQANQEPIASETPEENKVSLQDNQEPIGSESPEENKVSLQENQEPIASESPEENNKEQKDSNDSIEPQVATTTRVKRKASLEMNLKDFSDDSESDESWGSSSPEEEQKEKRQKRSQTTQNRVKAPNVYKPMKSIHELRRLKEVFIQYKRCYDFTNKSKTPHKLHKCVECEGMCHGEAKIVTEKCRFYGFRKLKATPKAIKWVGFSDANTDPTEEERNLWLTAEKENISENDIDTAKFVCAFVADQFCALVHEENNTLSLNDGEKIAWKRVVKWVREMCDVCCTTLFNYQWTCDKCGFVACRDCYSARLEKKAKPNDFLTNERDEYNWMNCRSNKIIKPHDLDDLMLTQVITGDALNELQTLLHKVRHEYKIPQLCDCEEANKYPSEIVVESSSSASLMVNSGVVPGSDSDSSDDEGIQDPDLLDLFSTPKPEIVNVPSESTKHPNLTNMTSIKVANGTSVPPVKNIHTMRALSHSKTLSETRAQYPTIDHSWLCNGKLLRLMDPTNADNYKIFQEVWKCGQPVLVSHVDQRLDKSLWTPESFGNDFGKKKGVFVNCMTGKLVMNQLLGVFWDGFENVEKRLEDEQGNAMLLKLKDWPEKADFADVLPSRFKDLMNALPLQDYTSREGRFNLTVGLPDKFIKPDLGPKMYVAYGSGLHLDKGTTNLHLDISDAVNVMVYIGEPKYTDQEDNKKHHEAVMDAIKDSDCDSGTIRRVLDGKDIPGALWHIYEARDADKIRNFLLESKILKGIRPDDRHDPIHDQSCYLDKNMRKDLMTKYNISGYPIIQCAGDAIFIPAGAPHQVRNLQNCIKVAEDFVSPENVHHCFQLTEEFRGLTEQHSNHEDKLQIKNIVYHSIKDAVSILLHAKNQANAKQDVDIQNINNGTKAEGEHADKDVKMEIATLNEEIEVL